MNLVNNSTLPMLTHELFMHYKDEATVPNPSDQAWLNQAVFFWTAKEPFEKKSLPPAFQNYEHKYFIVDSVPTNITVSQATVMPWFGMPGKGEKYVFSDENGHIPLSNLLETRNIRYIEIHPITLQNSAILQERGTYYLVLDKDTMRFEPSTDAFYFNNKKVTLGEAFALGGIKVIRFV